MASNEALEWAGQLWALPGNTHMEMDARFATTIAERLDSTLIKELRDFREALIWCSGSGDFQEGGTAREGWVKLCAPFLERLKEPVAAQQGEQVRDS